MNQVKNLPPTDIKEMFSQTSNIIVNLHAIRELRNAVSHHVFLIEYSFKTCTIDGKNNNSLEHNFKNLRLLLPKKYRYGINGHGGITVEIENYQFEIRKDNEKGNQGLR